MGDRRATSERAALARAAQAVDEREEELVAGFSVFTFAGLVSVAAPTVAELERALTSWSSCRPAVDRPARCIPTGPPHLLLP